MANYKDPYTKPKLPATPGPCPDCSTPGKYDWSGHWSSEHHPDCSAQLDEHSFSHSTSPAGTVLQYICDKCGLKVLPGKKDKGDYEKRCETLPTGQTGSYIIAVTAIRKMDHELDIVRYNSIANVTTYQCKNCGIGGELSHFTFRCPSVPLATPQPQTPQPPTP